MSKRAIAQPQKIASPANAPGHAGLLQRKCACGGSAGLTGQCGECDKKRVTLRRRSANQSEPSSVPPIVEEVLRSAGQPLDEQARDLMESRLGHDFSRVRVHADGQAAESARAVNATAYTVGQQVVFAAGKYQPQTNEGRRLLAHELTHVVQQGQQGDGGHFQGKLEIGSPDSSEERAADKAAEAVESETGAIPTRLSNSAGSPPVLQRKTGDAGSWMRGLFSSLVLGTFGFPDSWLQEYLTKLDETNDIEGDPDSDDKAREIVNEWKKGGSKFVLTAQRKALLIHEMLDGPTIWGDEDAILELLVRSYNFELSYIFGPGAVTGKRLSEDIPDDVGDRLRQFYYDRFKGSREAVLAGEINPIGEPPVPLGVELPPVGTNYFEIKPIEGGSTGWDVSCVLGILCTQDSAIVAQLQSLNVKMMERIDVKQWTFDGKSWNYEIVHPKGVNKPDEKLVGLVASSNCNSAAQTMFHEVHHQNQPEDMRKTHFTMEVDAYTETEKWAIKRGLPETVSALDSLRSTDEKGVQTPNTEAIEKKVTRIYGGSAQEEDKEKGEVKGHEAPNTTKIKLPNDKMDTRPSEEGDRYLEEPPVFIKETPLDQKDWACPGQKAKGVVQRRRAAGAEPSSVPPLVEEVLSSPGEPLNADTRQLMESRFGHDFSRVRVHADARAGESAQVINALAYTVGSSVVFDAGRYAPHTSEGRTLLAHELAHVVQQRSLHASPQPKLALSSSDDASEQEASNIAGRFERDTGPESKTPLSDLLAPVSPNHLGVMRQEAEPFTAAEKILKELLKIKPDAPPKELEGHQQKLREFCKGASKTEAKSIHHRTRPESKDVLGIYFHKLGAPVQQELRDILQSKFSPAPAAAKPAPEVDIVTGASPAPKKPLPKVDIVTGASPAPKEESDEEEKPMSVAEAFSALESLVLQEIGEINAGVGEIGNRSGVFTEDIKRVGAVTKWISKTLGEGKKAVTDAGNLAEPERAAKLEEASARYEAALIVAQVSYLDVCFLRVADVAENAGVTTEALMHTLKIHNVESTPLLNSVVGFDRKKMAQAANDFAAKIPMAKKHLEEWAKSIGVGAHWSGKAIAAADAIMIVYSLYSIGGAVAGGRGGPGASVRIPVIGGITAGGAATGVTIQISSAAIEGIRKLIQIGAISAPIVALGTGPTVTAPTFDVPTQLLRSTPSGKLTPNAGPFKGKQVTYEDGRNKHTKFANFTIDELAEAMRKPPKKGALSKFAEAKGDAKFGGQLSKEATDQYEKLMRDALEKGTERAGKFYFKADFDVGIDIMTGKRTPFYRVDGMPNGGHIIPVSEIPK